MKLRVTYANVVSTLALLLALSGGAYAATGGSLLMGRSNSASSLTEVRNPAGTAFSFRSKSGRAPFTVNGNSVKVSSLNADKVDGLDSTQLQGQTGPAGPQGPQGPQGPAGASTDVQVFETSGTWTKPAGAKTVIALVWGAGSGGPCGERKAAGGGITPVGGSGGGFSERTLDAASVGATQSVTVGAGGAGAPGRTADDSASVRGAAGEDSSFGALVRAGGGPASVGLAVGGSGLFPGAGNDVINATAAGGAGGGGHGGGVTIVGNPFDGYRSGDFPYSATAGGGGTAGVAPGGSGGPGGDAPPGTYAGAGGGGGAGSATGSGGNGGRGGFPGGGGGAGGSNLNGFTSGAGGEGADGLVVVITYF